MSGHVLSFKNEAFYSLSLPKFPVVSEIVNGYCIIWKICIKEVPSTNCYIKFIIKEFDNVIERVSKFKC